MFGAGSAHQGGDVVGQHLGRHVDDQGLLRQPGDGFEFEALLEAFECLLDAPSLVVEVADERGREVLGVQVGGEQAQLAVGRSRRTKRTSGAWAGQAQSRTSSALGVLSVTQASSCPERRNVLAAPQPLLLSQRMTKRMPRAMSNATNQAAG